MSKVSSTAGRCRTCPPSRVDLEVSKEIIGEFEVITNRFDAADGHAGTAIVNAVTKAGTDKFSGSAFFYFRDDSLNATDFFTGRVEPYQNRQYGGTFGGPIARGKTHFFRSYERQVEPKTLSANTGIAVSRRAGGRHRHAQPLFRPRRSQPHRATTGSAEVSTTSIATMPNDGVGGACHDLGVIDATTT